MWSTSRAAGALLLCTSMIVADPLCRSKEGEQGRFPLWEPTWDMRSSTIIQPCNDSGFLDAALYSQFGIVSVDWSNAKQLWVVPPMTCEEKLVEQAALLKAARPGVRVMGYRNIVKALPWFSTTRARLDDPATASWFLPFGAHNTTPYHVPQCDNNFNPPKCSTLYHDIEQVGSAAARRVRCVVLNPLTPTLRRPPASPMAMALALAPATVERSPVGSTSITT